MPGKKSLTKMEKQQEVKERAEKKEKKAEKTVVAVDATIKTEDLMNQLRKMKAITPPEVAIQFNIKVSAAKRVLEELRRSREIELVSQSQNLKVYALTQK